MINMMYLVLMAMLALNVSIDVLGAFWSFDRTIVSSTEQLEAKNAAIYAEIEDKAGNNPVKYGPVLDKAGKLKNAADDFYNTIQGYKIDMLRMAGVMDREQSQIPQEIENVDYLQSTSIAGEYFFPGGDMRKGRGEQFDTMMNSYRSLLMSMASNETLKKRIETDFSTSDIKSGDMRTTWLKEKFSAYPLAASLAFLSQYQSRIRALEADVMADLAGSVTENALLVPNTLQAIVIPQSTTVLSGEAFKAQVMLAAYDNTQAPEVFLSSGQQVPVESGKGIVSIPSGGVGQHKWGGYIRVKADNGQVKDFPFEGTFDVTAPLAVVSPTKMNVLYRGLDNPVSVSVPGVASSNVTLQGPGAKAVSPGQYVIDPSSVQGRTAKYTPVARMPDGTTRSFSPQEFRIKSVPQPQGQIRGQSSLKLNRGTLVQNKVEVVFPDFEFDIPMRVTGFTVKIPGKPSYQVSGDRFSGQAASAIQGAAAGTEVVIRDIKYDITTPSRIVQKEPTPIVVTLM